MVTNEDPVHKLSGKKFILCLAAWFIVCIIFYIFVHIIEGRRSQALIKKGVAISKDISSQSGLPLLEMKIDALGRLIEDATKKPGVVFASIIDHKNKIIAYTDQKQLFTLDRKKNGRLEGVNFWKISGRDHQKVMNFSADITFSDTRVGEVFISLAAEKMGTLQRPFLFFALLSLAIILFSFGVGRYKDCLLWWSGRQTKLSSPSPGFSGFGKDYEFTCPLCGSPGEFSLDCCQKSDLKSLVILKHPSGAGKKVNLKDLSDLEELTWFKNRIISRCARVTTTILSRKE
ncbi:hypothetical protein [Desulfospira joergensenii]|uniref:hypothetical protein n=1 Tax=Desulfospira joergensenii TaxID=53329 RepID=UPI0003B381C3|nr:hypothetical protein [Desulfospira joergensenii]